MARGDGVTVYRSSFFSSLVYGICGVIGIGIIGAVGIGLYGLNMVDRKFDHVLATGSGIIRSLPEVRESLPAVFADALNDRRAPEYREQLDVRANVVPAGPGGTGAQVVVEAVNHGPDIVTLLAIRVNLEDADGRLLQSNSAYIATPLAVEDEWAGPIMSGSTRREALRLWSTHPDVKAGVEVCDIRVWEKADSETAVALLPSR